MIDDSFSGAEVDDKLSRAFAALQRYRRRDEEGFRALLGDEPVEILMVALGWLEAAGRANWRRVGRRADRWLARSQA